MREVTRLSQARVSTDCLLHAFDFDVIKYGAVYQTAQKQALPLAVNTRPFSAIAHYSGAVILRPL